MDVLKTEIDDVFLLVPKVFGDNRGYFFESYAERDFKRLIGPISFVQDNESYSKRGVLRGLHYQKGTSAQAKLVRVVNGEILDIAVDIRKNSPTFGKYVAKHLSSTNKHQLFIPRGFAHGFVVLSEEAVFQYKCDNYYDPEAEAGIMYNDPTLAIDWQVRPEEICLSPKDMLHPLLHDAILF